MGPGARAAVSQPGLQHAWYPPVLRGAWLSCHEDELSQQTAAVVVFSVLKIKIRKISFFPLKLVDQATYFGGQ